ncbi:uncharacterized protein [Hyperolius riggenbachi]|uniref:uncharacterized protein n=1 Tax=Hyperolius riggenbachi TaxID=752182 RepID=UPI0035A26FB8
MPKCIIKNCSNKTGQPSSSQPVIMHVFPNDITGIKKWILSTGHKFENEDGVADKILKSKTVDLYRMCSEHFDQSCYTETGKKKRFKRLKYEAVPTIFTAAEDNIYIDEERVMSAGQKKEKKKPVCAECERSIENGTPKTFVDSSTQTDDNRGIESSFSNLHESSFSESHVEHPYSLLDTVEDKCSRTTIKEGRSLPCCREDTFSRSSSSTRQKLEWEAEHPSSSDPTACQGEPRGKQDQNHPPTDLRQYSTIPIMPSCIISGCPHTSAQNLTQQGIILHVFPSEPIAIRRWLENTGQVFNNIDSIIDKIVEGKKNDSFRICSSHFTIDSYNYKGTRKVLKRLALPSVFPHVENNLVIDEQWVLSSGKKRPPPKKKPLKTGESSEICSKCQNSLTLGITLVESSTQTEDLQMDFAIQGQSVIQNEHLQQLYALSSQFFSTPLKDVTVISEASPFVLSSRQESPISFGPPQFSLRHTPLIQEQQDDREIEAHSTTINPPTTQHDDSEMMCTDISAISDQKTPSRGEEYDRLDETQTDSEMMIIVKDEQDLYLETAETESNIFKNYVDMRKFVVFESCLDELLKKVKCQYDQSCQKTVTSVNKQLQGSAIIVRGVCEDGHRFKIFESQPKVKKNYAGNILLAASVICSGSNFSKMAHFCKVFGLLFFSEVTFHHYQKTLCFPAIHNAWEKERNSVVRQIARRPVTIGGDVQCDSPGHNAKYCVYTMMDLMSKKIVDFEVVQVTQCKSLAAMEKYGFEQCMSRVVENNIDIEHLATDRHVSIRKYMREKYPDIDHQFDVWHFAKNVSQKICEGSRKGGCGDLKKWIDKINNHFWWCVKNCRNDEHLLKQNWLSVLHHVRNEHEWYEDGVLHKCSHPPLSQQELENGNWLHISTPAYDKLCSIVESNDIIMDLKHLTWSCHTGPLEVFHSSVLKYHTKCIHFGYDGMQARTILAVLSNNYNTDKEQAVIKKKSKRSGEVGTKPVKYYAPKGKGKWSTRNIYEERKFDYLNDILIDTLQLHEGSLTSSWVSRSDSLPENLAKIPMPDNTELLSKRQS